jgi:histidinol-phosphatase (PHP family)
MLSVMSLPPDGHVHTEWSWDAVAGSMARSCERAVELGLPSVAFTEHADLTRWVISLDFAAHLPARFRVLVTPHGTIEPAELDVAGYLDCVARCRERFPRLRILSGVELSEPHWHADRVRTLLDSPFDRVLGSVHSIRTAGGDLMVDAHYLDHPADDVMRAYLAEVLNLVRSSGDFAVLAHIDYAVRAWPTDSFDPNRFEEEFRAVLAALASGGRALEINTRVPLRPEIIRWYEIGGDAVCFGSDAHDPALVANGFRAAVTVATAAGFAPQDDPHAFWTRHRVF